MVLLQLRQRSMKEIYILFILGLGCCSIQAQKFSTIEADFSIMEKHTLKDTSFLIVGSVSYDINDDRTTYEVSFPEKKIWEFRDSTLTVYDSLYKLEKVDTIGLVNELSIFKKILKDDLSDFGLIKAGFQIADVQKSSSSIIFTWKPPSQVKFIKEIISKKDDNNLTGLIVIDEDGKEINKTFYEDYLYIKDIPVPTRIKSHFKGDKEQVFKELQFRNVEIE